MARDSGTKAMVTQRRRKMALLGILAVLCAIAVLVQFQPRAKSAFDASVGDEGFDSAAPSHEPATPQRVSVAWPTALRRDVFAWDAALAKPTPPPKEEPLVAIAIVEPPPAATPEPQAAPAPTPKPTPEMIRAQALERLQFTGVIVGREARAVINGRLCRAGQEVEGFVIRRIEPRRLVLERAGVTIVLGL